MTLVLDFDLDMVKISYHTKNEISMSRHSKIIACTDTHTETHRQYENITFLRTRTVISHVLQCRILPTGPNSFILTFSFTEKRPRRRFALLPMTVGAPLNGKSWIRPCILRIPDIFGILGWQIRKHCGFY